MKKAYFISLSFFFITLLILFLFYNRYSYFYEKENINNYVLKNIDILNENLNTEKRYALSLSVLISQNENIRKSLQTNNQKLALQEIHKILKHINQSTNIKNIDIQVHTKDLRAFARNWDKNAYFGQKLSSYRKGLVKVKNTKTSFVSIELGKRLNIKAIAPILDGNNHFLGSIEVIINFKDIEDRLKKFNLKILFLLDEKFINIAVDLKNNKKIGKFYIAEKVYSQSLYKKIINNKKIFKQKKHYFILGDEIIVLIPMKSLGIQNVGLIVMSMSAKQDELYSYSYDNTNFENDTYIFNKHKKREVIIK